MATTTTPWIGATDDKLYLQSGQFTSTVKTSQDISGVDNNPSDIEWDGTNTPWVGVEAGKLYLQSGQFSSTLKTSEDVSGIDTVPVGISWDGINTPWSGTGDGKLYLQSGQFTSTIKTSRLLTGLNQHPQGISADIDKNTPWVNSYALDDNLIFESGQFSSTIKSSLAIGSVDTESRGISWDGTNTPWIGLTADKLYLQSGQFNSTLKTSQDIGSIDTAPTGISTDDYISRIGSPLDKTVEQTITLSDDAVYDLDRAALPIEVVTQTLTFVEEVGYLLPGPIEPYNTLEFEQTVGLTTNNYRVGDVLVFEQSAYIPRTYSKSIIQTLELDQEVEVKINAYKIQQSLYFEQFIGLNNVEERSIVQFLELNDQTSVETNFYAFFITDALSFTQDISVRSPYNLTIDQTLTFEQLTTVTAPYNITVEMLMDWEYNQWGWPSELKESFYQTVDVRFIATRAFYQKIDFVQTVNVVKEKVGAVSKTVNDTLTFAQIAARVYGGESTLTLVQAVNIEQCTAAKNTLQLLDNVIYSTKKNYPANNTLVLKSTVSYELIMPGILCNYNPSIGSTTDPDAPNPPHLTSPTVVKYDNIQLSYPIDDPTDIVTLRGPEFDDRDQLHFSRINRETRGGTLIIFADSIWPQNQRLLLSFIGLSETEAQDTLTFIRGTIGKQIGLRDWEGKTWIGVILTPENPITRNNVCNIAIDLEFEGVLIHRNDISQNLAPLSQFIKVVHYNRPLGNTLTLVDQFNYNIDYDRIITDTLVLTDQFDRNVAYNQSVTDTLILSDQFDCNVDYGRTLTDTLTLSDQFDRNIDYGRTLTDTLTLSDQVIPFHDTIWVGFATNKLYLQSGQFTSTVKTSEYIGSIDTGPAGISWNGTDTPWCGYTDDKLYLQSGQFTSTLKTSQAVDTIDLAPTGISWDRTNTPWCGDIDDKLYLQSGQFTSTLKTSEDISGIETIIRGISFDGTNTPWIGGSGADVAKLFLQSGQFTSTLKTSQLVGGTDPTVRDISFNGIDTPWVADGYDKLYLQSGQFTSTVKISQNIGSTDGNPLGIDVTGLPFRLSA